jgi:hypothetical protein
MQVAGLLKADGANPGKAGCIAGIAGYADAACANAYGLQLKGLYQGLIGLIAALSGPGGYGSIG